MATYSCHNDPKYGTVPKAILAQLPSDGPGRLKCPNCRTATAAGMLALLGRMSDPRYAAPDSPDRLMEFLFGRAAAQRKSAANGYKDRWAEVSAAWAAASAALATMPQLQSLCGGIRIRFGSGVERQALQALGQALVRAADVDRYLEHSGGDMATTYNACADLLQDLLGRVDTFRQLESFRASVAGVRELREATARACELLDGTLDAVESAGAGRRPGTATGHR